MTNQHIPSPEAIDRAQELVNDFATQTLGKPLTLALARLGILAIVAIEDAIQSERWACERATNPSHWIYPEGNSDYKRGYIDGLHAAHERIAARLESDPSHSPDPLSEETP
jgi:hypothetical protein